MLNPTGGSQSSCDAAETHREDVGFLEVVGIALLLVGSFQSIESFILTIMEQGSVHLTYYH